jgi:hypothetical protein
MGTTAVPAAAQSTDYLGASAHSAAGKLNQLTPALKETSTAAATLPPRFRDIKKELGFTASAASDLTSALDTLTGTIDTEPILIGKAAQAWKDLNNARAQGPDSKSIQDMEIFTGKIDELTVSALQAEGALAQARGGTAFVDWLANLKTQLDLTNPVLKLWYQNAVNAASAAGKLPSLLTGQITRTTGVGAHKAAGGPVTAGTPYTVGEVGPELFVPNQSGTIIPASQTAKMGGGGNTYIVNVQGLIKAETPADILRTMQRLQAIAP